MSGLQNIFFRRSKKIFFVIVCVTAFVGGLIWMNTVTDLYRYNFFSNDVVEGECQQFSYLAKSFVQGKLYFVEEPGTWDDTAFYEGKYYWPLGPFPALMLVPFVYTFNLFHIFFKQGYLQIWLVFGIFYLCFIIAKRKGFSEIDSIFLTFAFCFASVFLGVGLTTWSWCYAQVVTTLLIFWTLLEYTGKKRYSLIGMLMGFVLLTRVTAAIGIVFFCFEIFKKSKTKGRDLLSLLAPFIIMGSILAVYNFARFSNLIEQGYSYQLLNVASTKARCYGLFALIHLPANLYYFLLSGPLPVFKDGLSHVLRFPFVRSNPWGMSVFITSPYLVYLFFQKYNDWESRGLLATALLIALPIFLYYAIGYAQFGFRYSLDFLPYLHFLLIVVCKNKVLNSKFKLLILTSAILNLYLFSTF